MAIRHKVGGRAEVVPEAVSQDLQKNLGWLKRYLGYKETFDIIVREFKIGERDAALVYVDSFVSQTNMTLIMQELFRVPDDRLDHPTLQRLLNRHVPFIEIIPETRLDNTAAEVLAGPAVLLVDGLAQAIVLDVRKYPGRTPSEPSLERVLRGPKDGFVETLVDNTILLRRRLRDPNLRFEVLEVGRRSRSDVAIIYIKDVANPTFVREVRERLKSVDVDALTMSEKGLEEWLVRKPWWNPFPRTRFTARPDVAAEHLTEGHVLVMIDTSPNALILPVTLVSFLQSIEEYHEDVLVGTYLKWVRLIGIVFAWVGPGLWYALVADHVHIGGGWSVLVTPTVTSLPLFGQLLLAEFGVDLLRLALTFSPDPLTQSMGFLGAVLLGDIIIKARMVDALVIIVVAVAAVGTFSAPDIDFGMALRLLRIFLLLLVGIGAAVGLVWVGFALGLLIPLVMIGESESFGIRYSWPIYPFNGPAFVAAFSRKPLNRKVWRPALTLTRDSTHRRPPESGED